jgi:hypothetical protein
LASNKVNDFGFETAFQNGNLNRNYHIFKLSYFNFFLLDMTTIIHNIQYLAAGKNLWKF